mmetsp:Transcript_8377/g.16803  ORF Transcript_8377/g.16803 Transcript_8377/m.16803 type:complete len:224 (-) Transcript_8377:2357-3028(-)
MLLRQLHSLLPVVQQDASVDRGLNVPGLLETPNRLLVHTDALEHAPDLHQSRVALAYHLDALLHPIEVLEPVKALDHLHEILGLGVVLRGLVPLEPISVVLADLVPCLDEHLIVAAARLYQRHDPEPVAEPDPEIVCQVLPVDFSKDGLSLVEPLEVRGHLGPLLHLVPDPAQPLDVLDPGVVTDVHKGLLGGREVQSLKGGLGEQPPQPRVGMLLDKQRRLA